MSQDDPNQHVREYLEYYLGFEQAPGFAVLLNGKWGTGKTFLVKNMLRALYDEKTKKGEEPDYAYVSLYGVSSGREFDDAVLRAAVPGLDSFWGKVGYAVGSRALKKYAGDDAEAKDLALDVFKRGVYVWPAMR